MQHMRKIMHEQTALAMDWQIATIKQTVEQEAEQINCKATNERAIIIARRSKLNEWHTHDIYSLPYAYKITENEE